LALDRNLSDSMYSEYYGLKADPFRLSPDHQFCLPHRSFAKAKAYMRYALHRNEGFVMITGAPGTGKTTLIDDLLAGIDQSEFSIGRLVSVQVEADDILRLVANEFGINTEQSDKSDILRVLATQFTRNFKQGKRSLLIVDEAQGLALSALEELRLLTNLRVGGHPMLQIFLVGQEELRDMVTRPELEQLNQRMIASYHMEPLKPDEFVAYVLHRLTVAGWRGSPHFKSELFPQLFKFSNGLPRRINHICSRLLLHGFLEEKSELAADDIEIVIKELRAEHYSITESSALITQEEFNAKDLERMAHSAIREQSAFVELPRQQVGDVAPLLHVDGPSGQSQQSAMASVIVHTDTPAKERGSEEQVVRKQKQRNIDADRVSFRLPLARVAGWAAALLLGFSMLLLMLLVALPNQQLDKLASQSWLNEVGLIKVRAQVSSWSGGRLPLKTIDIQQLQPVSPAPTAIERANEEPQQVLGDVKTVAVSPHSGQQAPRL